MSQITIRDLSPAVEAHLRGIAPIVAAWADAGHQSFAEISTDQIRVALASITEPQTGRHSAELGLKSMFRTLKGRRLIFADPTRGLKPTPVATNIPLPLDPALIRAELDSPNPAVALAVALPTDAAVSCFTIAVVVSSLYGEEARPSCPSDSPP